MFDASAAAPHAVCGELDPEPERLVVLDVDPPSKREIVRVGQYDVVTANGESYLAERCLADRLAVDADVGPGFRCHEEKPIIGGGSRG